MKTYAILLAVLLTFGADATLLMTHVGVAAGEDSVDFEDEEGLIDSDEGLLEDEVGAGEDDAMDFEDDEGLIGEDDDLIEEEADVDDGARDANEDADLLEEDIDVSDESDAGFEDGAGVIEGDDEDL